MKIIITEEQKKKLFVPRNIDKRQEQLKKELSQKTKEILSYFNITKIRNHGRIDDYDSEITSESHIEYGYTIVIIDGINYYGFPKVRQFESDYNRILDISKEGSFDAAKKSLDDLKEKIRKYRKAGLDKGGEMSTENLVFKTLRRSGLMEKISKLGVGITDKQYTIETLGESKKKLFTLEELFNNK